MPLPQLSHSPGGDGLQLRQGLVILRPVRDLLGTDQRGESDDLDLEPGRVRVQCVSDEVLVADLLLDGERYTLEHVQAPGRGVPGTDLCPGDEGPVNQRDWHALSRGDRDSRLELHQHRCDTIEVLPRPAWADIEVLSGACRTVLGRGAAANDHVLDPLARKRADQGRWIEPVAQRPASRASRCSRVIRACSRATNRRTSSGVARFPPAPARTATSSGVRVPSKVTLERRCSGGAFRLGLAVRGSHPNTLSRPPVTPGPRPRSLPQRP
jgi:hypothetical protein